MLLQSWPRWSSCPILLCTGCLAPSSLPYALNDAPCLAESRPCAPWPCWLQLLENTLPALPRRAELSYTHRHLTEFTGLDLEMVINEHYSEVMDILDKLFLYIFDGLNHNFGELAGHASRLQMARLSLHVLHLAWQGRCWLMLLVITLSPHLYQAALLLGQTAQV